MTIVRWEPLRELSSLQTEMNRLFNTAFEAPATGNGGARRWTPAMDLVETDEHFVLRADLPGMSEQDVSIELEDNVLTLSGERKAEHEEKREGFYRVERAFGAFSRSLTLPKGVDAEAVTARLRAAACSRCASRSPSSASRARSRSAPARASRRRSRARAPDDPEGPPRAGPLLSYGALGALLLASARAIPARAPAPAR